MASAAGGRRSVTSATTSSLAKRHASSSAVDNLGKVASGAAGKKRPALANITNQRHGSGSINPSRGCLRESSKITKFKAKTVDTNVALSGQITQVEQNLNVRIGHLQTILGSQLNEILNHMKNGSDKKGEGSSSGLDYRKQQHEDQKKREEEARRKRGGGSGRGGHFLKR